MTRDRASVPACGSSGYDHAARYERLRAYALTRHAPPSRDGLVVVLRQGVAAWIDEWSRLPTPTSRPVQVERTLPSFFPDDASTELVRVLAAMAMGCIMEVHA